MDNLLIRPDTVREMSSAEVNQNIQIALNHLKKSENISDSFKKYPVYKKLTSFSLRSFFYNFGATNTPLCKFIQTKNEKDMPNIVVISCSNNVAGGDDTPILLNDDIYITDTFFREWISSIDKAVSEKPVLNLVLAKVRTSSRLS